MQREELAAWLRLQLTPGVGNSSARRLLAAFGLPAQIFTQSSAALTQVVSDTQARALQAEPEGWSDLLDTTWNWLQSDLSQRRILVLDDASYPQALLQIEDPPLLLYAMGDAALWQRQALASCAASCLAIVGSRNPTPQGASNALQFAKLLSDTGLTIVSGLALGIDGAAHEGALEGAAPGHLATIAVVGTGLDRVYPRQHRDLAHRIASNGVLLSEYALGTAPTPANFPRRNRIIAGLARGTLVVEAALKSGSLITAQLACEQGKEVFAIPGSIHSTQSHGCHALIKQGAKLVESAQDILEELQWSVGQDQTTGSAAAKLSDTDHDDFPGDDDSLLQALGFDPTGLDALLARTGMNTPTLQVRLMSLELEGRIARLPGG
ncbi:MAG: DNA-processing protein DprA, partial [Rhodoferax sp.]